MMNSFREETCASSARLSLCTTASDVFLHVQDMFRCVWSVDQMCIWKDRLTLSKAATENQQVVGSQTHRR